MKFTPLEAASHCPAPDSIAATIAGAVLAFTPAAALMFRFNNPDALLVLRVRKATGPTRGTTFDHIGLAVPDVPALEQFIVNVLSRVPGVGSIRSSFALKQVKYKTALPLPAGMRGKTRKR